MAISEGLRARVLAFNRARAVEREAAAQERERADGLSERFAALSARHDALEGMMAWADLDGAIEVGTEVRYFRKTYRCIKAHTKSVLRNPGKAEYWEEVEG